MQNKNPNKIYVCLGKIEIIHIINEKNSFENS